MKIVINKCYGGFGLSALAQKEYLKRKNKKAFFINKLCTKNLGKVTSKFPPKENYFYDGDIPRNDPDLIAVVEKLGKKAN